MAGWHKRFRHLWWKTKIKERWESKPHATPLIGDWRPAKTAAHLAGKNSCIDVLFTVIEFQAVHTFGYPDIMLVEDGYVNDGQGFLAENPRPTEEVRHSVAGNLCRCTGYTKYVEAILDAAEKMEK